jgi:hypothetical protein
MFTTPPSPKPCVHCGKDFIPKYTATQIACSWRCAASYVKKERLAKEKQERAQDRAKRERLETIPELIKAAQKEFNAYIRERDKDQPCICCGRTATGVDGLKGHGWDAGHYRSTGAAPHLRFNESNCHRQLVLCNRYGAGRAVDYRVGLIARIGIEAVEALEADNAPKKWTREELRSIRDTYRARVREMKKEQA